MIREFLLALTFIEIQKHLELTKESDSGASFQSSIYKLQYLQSITARLFNSQNIYIYKQILHYNNISLSQTLVIQEGFGINPNISLILNRADRSLIDSWMEFGMNKYPYKLSAEFNQGSIDWQQGFIITPNLVVVQLVTSNDQHKHNRIKVVLRGLDLKINIHNNTLSIKQYSAFIFIEVLNIYVSTPFVNIIFNFSVGYITSNSQIINTTLVAGSTYQSLYILTSKVFKLKTSTLTSIAGCIGIKYNNTKSLEFILYIALVSLSIIISTGSSTASFNYTLFVSSTQNISYCKQNKYHLQAANVDICPFRMSVIYNTCIPSLLYVLYSLQQLNKIVNVTEVSRKSLYLHSKYECQGQELREQFQIQWDKMRQNANMNICISIMPLNNLCIYYNNYVYKQGQCIYMMIDINNLQNNEFRKKIQIQRNFQQVHHLLGRVTETSTITKFQYSIPILSQFYYNDFLSYSYILIVYIQQLLGLILLCLYKMEQMETSYGKLLYIVYQLNLSRLISERDKHYLKDLIIYDDPKVFAIMDAYNSNGTQLTLRNDMLSLVWSDRSHRTSQEKGNQSPNSSNSSLERKRNPLGLVVKIPPKNIQKIEGRNL